jgi:MYXO-CTERM domain-containing protein
MKGMRFCSMLSVACLVVPSPAAGSAAGIAGVSGKSPLSTCANCHYGGIAPTKATLAGPQFLVVGQTGDYSFTIETGSASSVAGLDVAVSAGTLSTVPGSSPPTQILSGEITHTSPTAGTSTRYDFRVTAPATVGDVTLYADGLNGNGDGMEGGDGDTATTLQISIVPLGTDLASVTDMSTIPDLSTGVGDGSPVSDASPFDLGGSSDLGSTSDSGDGGHQASCSCRVGGAAGSGSESALFAMLAVFVLVTKRWRASR